MCLNKSAQPIKLTIVFKVIGCQGNDVNSVSSAHQEAPGAEKPDLQRPGFFNLSLNQTLNHNISIHGSPFGHFCTGGKHCTSFFFFSLKNYLAAPKLITNEWSLMHRIHLKAAAPRPCHRWFHTHWCFQRKTGRHWNFFLKKSPHWYRIAWC